MDARFPASEAGVKVRRCTCPTARRAGPYVKARRWTGKLWSAKEPHKRYLDRANRARLISSQDEKLISSTNGAGAGAGAPAQFNRTEVARLGGAERSTTNHDSYEQPSPTDLHWTRLKILAQRPDRPGTSPRRRRTRTFRRRDLCLRNSCTAILLLKRKGQRSFLMLVPSRRRIGEQ